MFSFPSFGRPKFRADGLLSQTIKKHLLLLLLLLLVFLQVKSANKQQQNRFISFGSVRPPLTVQTQDGRTPQVADARAGRKNFFPWIYLLIIIIKLLLLLLLGFFWAGASIFSTHPLSDKDGVKGIPPSLIFPILSFVITRKKWVFLLLLLNSTSSYMWWLLFWAIKKKNSFRLFPTNI